MNPDQVSRALISIKSEFREILDRESCDRVLMQAKTDVENTSDLYGKFVNRTDVHNDIVNQGWGFSINRNAPLKFHEMLISGHKFWVDLTCEFRWIRASKNENVPSKRNLAFRLWTSDKRIVFRERWDAPRIRDEISERVMLRFHFDEAELGQEAARSHFQVGGVADIEEYCWLHEKVNQPRLPHPPVDLVLACELVGATLYPSFYKKIAESGNWKGVVNNSQTALLLDYYEACISSIKNNRSVVGDLIWPTSTGD